VGTGILATRKSLLDELRAGAPVDAGDREHVIDSIKTWLSDLTCSTW
jgi:hypothetical protein